MDDSIRLPLVRLRRIALAAAVVAAVSACAGPEQPDKAAYVAAADKVCDDAGEDIDEETTEYELEVLDTSNDDDVSLNVAREERWTRTKIIPIYKDMDSSLRSLTPPEGDSAYLGDLYNDLSRLIVEFNSRPSQGRDIIREDERLRQRFESYGMDVCGTV